MTSFDSRVITNVAHPAGVAFPKGLLQLEEFGTRIATNSDRRLFAFRTILLPD